MAAATNEHSQCGNCRMDNCGVCALQYRQPTQKFLDAKQRKVDAAIEECKRHRATLGTRVSEHHPMPECPEWAGDPSLPGRYSTDWYIDPYYLSRLGPVLCRGVWRLLPIWEYVATDEYCWEWIDVRERSKNFDV